MWVAILSTTILVASNSLNIRYYLFNLLISFAITIESFFMDLMTSSLITSILIIDASLILIAISLVVTNNLSVKKEILSTHYFDGDTLTGNVTSYENYTLENYNSTISGLFDNKKKHFMDMFGFSALIGILMPGVPTINNILSSITYYTKFSWLISTPHMMLQNVGFVSFNKNDLTIKLDSILKKEETLQGKNLIMILPTNGKNLKTVYNSVSSAMYWYYNIQEKHDFPIGFQSWIVCEENDFNDGQPLWRDLTALASRVVIVPKDFQTPNSTQYKARALTYVNKVLADESLASKDVWIYHQDDETMIGEDTILGILDFIENAREDDVYAAGIIIYADGWDAVPSKSQEPARSYDDFRIMFTGKTKGLLSFGHHGSHLLVRADAEQKIGWDFGRVMTEDWLFGLKLWQNYKPSNITLKGFAYEKPPLNVKDLMKQRRRWAQGAFGILFRKDIKLRYRLAAFYGLLSWLSAFPSLIALILSIINPTGGLFLGSGVFAGFTWFSLFKFYSNGYYMNRSYFRNLEHGIRGKFKRTLMIVCGMIVESISPWYALFKPSNKFEVIKKDT